MFRVTVSDHMMVAHSLRGETFGPAQARHGATYVVEVTFGRPDLDADGVVVDIGLAAGSLHEVLADLTYRDLDEHPHLAGQNTTTEVLARYVADRVVEGVQRGRLGESARGITHIEVTLRESPVAWASYQRTL